MDAAVPFDIERHRSLYPFRSHWLIRGGHRLHYVDEGRGEAMVLLHGNPTWSFYYRQLIRAFSPRYRVIAPDHMGCGLSDRPDEREFAYTLEGHVANLKALLDHLSLPGKVTLVAHDWGGMIGMAWACANAERVGRVILLNTGAFLIPPGKGLPWQLWFVKYFPLLPTVLVRGFNAFALGATVLGTKKGLAPEVRRGLTAPYNSWRNRLATLRFVQDIPASPRDPSYALAKWTDEHLHLLRGIPMLILWGGGDFVFDDKILDEWRRRFPEAEVHTFPDAGHYVLEDKPDEIIALMTDFLSRHPL
ncbi:MAG TPA: alpha/beta fold hydrolase [Syntrophales bacterium]|nr:alpha/beta fold hydrolase [Syntrophales bacterium]HOM06154.1 alpha/beta fold hydrolase [Syntrophales bacterium]HON98982.1 alpha/beta fold hydrolase [Syntrophales bacterium]HPC01008.1 alpha/beta fold hydrolase [Syntrophales bacterium]HPQ05637.1 alpha/beta fold hydrolase [Syntrophales bacterium]